MIAKSRNVYIDKLVKIFNKCNNTYHRISKMKPVEVKLNTQTDFDVESIFAKSYTSDQLQKVFALKKLKKLHSGHILLVTLTVSKLLEPFMKKNSKKNISNRV